jgi:transposase
VDRAGIPLAARVSAANVPDVVMLLATVVACPIPRYGTGGRMPEELYADRAYDSDAHEGLLRWVGIEPKFAQRGTPHGSGLGKHRYVVERTIAAVHQNRRLKVRYEKRSDIHQAFLTLACIKLCWYRLDPDRQ